MQEAATTEVQLATLRRNVTSLENKMSTFKVTSPEELNEVATIIGGIEKLKKQAKEAKEVYTKPAKEIIAAAKTQYDPIVEKCDHFRGILDRMAITYHDQQEKIRRDEEAKLAAKVEAGRMKPETAVAKMENLTTPEKTVRTDTGSTLSFSKRKVATITNPELIPDEFWVIDEVRVRKEALARNTAGVEQIPGVTIEEVTGTTNRA